MKFAVKMLAGAAMATLLFSAHAQKGETVKIALIDPQTGLMGPLGTNQMRSWQYMAEEFSKNNPAGVKFEIVAFDNKLSPAESANALKAAIDQGIRYVAQGNGSSVLAALVDGISKHNDRNPGKEVMLLNYAAVDPDFTNSKCNFWHFRFDADTSMKIEAMTTFMKDQKDVHKVFLLNQNYSHGQQVAKFAKDALKRKRPDIEIVGEDLHPLAQVKDFSPYVAKIKSSGADTVITGNWGSDLALLIKAGKDAGLNANFYTYYASTTGVPTAMGSAGADHVKYVGYWNVNNNGFKGADIVEGYKKKYNDDFYLMASYTGIAMLAKAIKETKSAEPAKVAKAFEGMKVDSLNGTFEMRASDHQGQQPLYIATWKKVDGKDVKFDQENTGYGWKTDAVLDAYVASQPTSCQMKRPH